MQIVILSGGLGTRLKPFTEKIPKGMILINRKPFLQYQLELLKKNNITDIVLCVGYLAEKIVRFFGNGKKFGVNITYSLEKNKLLGTAGALKHAEKYLNKEFLVMYGDSYLTIDYKDFISYFDKIQEPILMSVYRNYNKFDKSNVKVKDGLVVKYEKYSTDKMTHIDYGISIISKKFITQLKPNRFFKLEDIIKKNAEKKSIHAYIVKNRFYEIGSIQGLKEFTKYIKNHNKIHLTG